MSDKTSSSGSSGSGSPVASKSSTQTASSAPSAPSAPSSSLEEQDSEEQEDESTLEESLSSLEDESEWYMDDEESLGPEELMEEEEPWEEEKPLKEEYLEEEYLEEEEEYLQEEYLEEDDYLDEKTFFQRETYLFKGAFVKEKTYLKEKKFQKHLAKELKAVGKAAGKSKLKARTKVSSTVQGINLMASSPSSSEYDLKLTTSSYYSLTGVSITLRDQSSQTEWPYKSNLGTPLKSKATLGQDDSSALTHKKSDLEASESFPQGSFWDTILNEPFDKQEDEAYDSLPSSYQSVFREIITELASRHQLEEELDMPLSKLMEGENRKKLGLLLKKNFEKYRETIMWIIKKREASQKMAEKCTTITYIISTLLQPQEPEPKEVVRRVSTFKRLRLDIEWTRAKMKAHQGDGKLIAYHSGRSFHVLFPNCTGQIYYPSGNLALLITRQGVAKFTYIVLEDCVNKKIRGLVNNSGHATFYNEDGGLWLSLSKLLGYYFPNGKRQKAWNWWNLSVHVHAPPIMRITLQVNKYVHIQIRSQDKVLFYFFPPKQKKICLNMGTKFKFLNLKLLQVMKKKAILETDPRPTSWKIQALLGKISKSLNFLTLSDLEDFTEVVQVALNNLTARKSRIWV
ncbi:glutamate-rich protein 6B [Peromyscus eremicus]|uniref:glutamate-rich protein 6B n=1 Tax=Peromyscus eremicus TaxID=42410 RepID=UPI0027DD6F18|nr:glutamate-rich protein 6B [Peromyscus eremicus]